MEHAGIIKEDGMDIGNLIVGACVGIATKIAFEEHLKAKEYEKALKIEKSASTFWKKAYEDELHKRVDLETKEMFAQMQKRE